MLDILGSFGAYYQMKYGWFSRNGIVEFVFPGSLDLWSRFFFTRVCSKLIIELPSTFPTLWQAEDLQWDVMLSMMIR